MGVLDAFSDPVKLLQEFMDLIEYSDESRRVYGSGTTKFNDAIRSYLHKLAERTPENSFKALCNHYVPFYYEGIVRLKSNPKFIDWVKETEFSIMPDIFTKEVLLYAIAKIEISRKMAATVLDTMREKPCENSSFNARRVCGGVLSWIGIFLFVIGWMGVICSIFLLLDSPAYDGTWFVCLFLSVCKILLGVLLRKIARSMGFTHSHHPVLGAIVGGAGILLSVFGWIGIAGAVLSLFFERSTIDPLTNGVTGFSLVVIGSIIRYYGRHVSGKTSDTTEESTRPKD